MSQEYTNYIQEHKANVEKAYHWLVDHNIIEPEWSASVYENIVEHDMSKYSNYEYDAYDKYFYGTRTEKVEREFNYAWLHHIHNNPHHWQYWVLVNDEDGIKALEMPKEFVYEMFVDHWSFSWKSGNLTEIKDWYNSHKKKMILHEKTRKLYEEILDKVLKLLKDEEKNKSLR